MELLKRVDGKKTYLVAGLLAVYALSGLLLGKLDGNTTVTLVLEALALAGLRHGISKAS